MMRCRVSAGHFAQTAMSFTSASTIPGYVLRLRNRSHAMDGVYSILAGLVLRLVVDAATFHNVKLSGTLIGLWEGVVLLHYANKAPTSTDPYLAYGVRLFVDFLVTESVFRLLIVLLWSTMGMVLADVAPAVWADSGLKRQWSLVRRDLFRSARIFAKRRTTTVRFAAPTIASMSAAPSVVSVSASTLSGSSVGSTIGTTAIPSSMTTRPDSPTTSVAPTISVASAPRPIIIRRRSSVPGTFPGTEWSETDTDAGTVVVEDEEDGQGANAPPRPSHVTISRIVPIRSDFSYTNSLTTSPRSSTYSLDYSDDPSASNPVDIPSDVEDDLLTRVNVRQARSESERETTPKQRVLVLPPTPSESLIDWGSESGEAEDVPPSPWMPLIPDQEPLEEWETVEVPAPPPAGPSQEPEEEENDDASVAAPSTVAPDHPAPVDEPIPSIPIPMPVPELGPVPEPEAAPVDEITAVLEEPVPATESASPPKPDALDAPQHPPQRTPPPSFEDLYGSEPPPDQETAPPPVATESTELAASRPTTPIPSPSPVPSIRRALSLRKEAIEITARIAALARQRKSSLSEGHGAATAAAMLAKVEMDRAEKELALLNEKAEGAFVGAYNPPTASLYELNTTGLTGEEAVRQTETRLGKLLLAPVPPAGTTPEDLAHDSPNRGALKVVMEQSIKGRMVKQKLLSALGENGLSWVDDTSRPNIIYVMLPVQPEPQSPADAADEPPTTKDEDEDDAKEY
ncbi:hypothetical protein B0H15DRAFT_178116 [Mycena belliarum]|uniref:Uncharacterized protein n=1 Tax=Mycena belliarum TaxID=1033014 RepID=A0AAD6U793_9AGAR|nr:hypothetical protein B0H15DRAFT_178116 [Mycena belliae]